MSTNTDSNKIPARIMFEFRVILVGRSPKRMRDELADSWIDFQEHITKFAIGPHG